ncbi:MAG: CsgG/HfaB family protein [Treponema sp.]|nr:CsgG/HfaB family protein [Treponema sp.]
MKKMMMATVLIFLAVYCFAQGNPRVVVIPLENRAGQSHRDDTETLTELLVNFINDTRRLSVIDRGALNAMMTAQRWQMDDWADEDKTAEMGRVLNAQFIVRGTVSMLGSNLVISARILDINTAEVLGSANVQIRGMDEAYNKMEEFARNLTRTIGTAAQQRQQTTAEPRQDRASDQKTRPARDNTLDENAWENRLIFLGWRLGMGLGEKERADETYDYYGYYYYDYSYDLYLPVSLGVAFDFCPFRWLTLSINPSIAFDVYYFELGSSIPLLVRLGYKFDTVELTANIGANIGHGFALGATLGFRPRRKGVFFLELGYMPYYSLIELSLGVKYGIGNRKW